jgi:predicted TIM-barrel fold metal-dependent hydrolase
MMLDAQTDGRALGETHTSRQVIDADGHVRETDEEIIQYMPEAYLARQKALLHFPLVPHHGWHRSDPRMDARQLDFRVPDCHEWSAKLDEGCIEAAVLFPTRFMHIGQVGHPPYAVDLCRAYNDFLEDRFLRHDSRLRGMALLPLQDVPSAVTELRRAVTDYGMVGGILPAEGLPLSLGHPQYRAIFEEADRLGCALGIHSCNSLRDNDRYLQPNEAATLTHVIPQMRQFTSVMFSGVLDGLKNIRVGFLEAGSGWVAFLISKIEQRFERLRDGSKPVLPSDLLARRQLFFECGEEPTTRRDVELLGDDCLLWASDFPHEATKTNLQALVENFFEREDLSSQSKSKIIYDNAKHFYGLA